jgi:hypothetical protein
MNINLAPKSDRKTLLSLNYYQNQFMQQILVITMISFIMLKQFKNNNGKLPVEKVYQQGAVLVNILDHEFFKRDGTKDISVLIKENLDLLEKFGEI